MGKKELARSRKELGARRRKFNSRCSKIPLCRTKRRARKAEIKREGHDVEGKKGGGELILAWRGEVVHQSRSHQQQKNSLKKGREWDRLAGMALITSQSHENNVGSGTTSFFYMGLLYIATILKSSKR